ncbi:MAG: polysaccharide biosynthesis C-terminal domain-containing protein [Bacteroidota bacterium]|nr:polysaccharide biosynthesis C-terminal domain-containing protein [Bacteroidota bacterium]
MSLKKGIFYTLLTQAPTLLLFFISSTLMTRLLGDVGRGAYALLNNQVALLSMLLWLNLGLGITYFTSKNNAPTRTIVGTAVTMVLINVLVTPLILLAFYSVNELQTLFMPVNATYGGYYIYVYASIVLGTINSSVASILLGIKKFKVLNLMSILNATLSAISFLVLYLVKGDLGSTDMLPLVLGVTLIVQLMVSLVWMFLFALFVRMPPIPIVQWSLLKPLITFSLIGHISNLINLINYRFDVWVVDTYHGTASLGLYAVAVGVGQLLFYIPEPFSRVVQPYLYGQQKDEMLGRFKAVARVNFTVVLALAIMLAITARWLIPFLFGEVFSGSVAALQLLLPGVVFSASFKLLAQLVVQGNGQQFNLYATMAGAVVTLILDFALIPEWGIEGAAIASTLSYFTILLVVIGVIRFKLDISVHDLFFIHRSDLRKLHSSIPWRTIR